MLQVLNLAGVVVLVAVCVGQWKVNRAVNLEANRLEKTRIEQAELIEQQEKRVKGCMADLDVFREEIEKLSKSLKGSETTSLELEKKLAMVEAEREEMKGTVAQWTEAVRRRDEALTKAGEQSEKLASDRDSAVKRYNELAGKYNQAVDALNRRTEELNLMVEKQNKDSERQTK